MDLTFLAELVERKSELTTQFATPGHDPGDRLERSIGELLEGARGRLSAATLFSLRAMLQGAVDELRRHGDPHPVS